MCDFNRYQIDLIPTGDDASFRTKDVPGGEIHRREAAEQSVSGFVFQADLIEVIHGRLAPDGALGTLIIIEFRFRKHSNISPSRRFRSADIRLRFFDLANPKGGANDPKIHKIAPDGEHAYNTTVVSKEVEWGVHLGLKSGAEIGGVGSLGGGVRWGTTSKMDVTHKAVISGLCLYDQYRCWGGKNVAWWSIKENIAQKDGIPGSLRTAVLLERKAGIEKFRMETEIEVTVDIMYNAKLRLEKMFGRFEKDEAVTFDSDPDQALETDRTDLDPDYLSQCVLNDEVRVMGQPLVRAGYE